jgi:hypothetical protein
MNRWIKTFLVILGIFAGWLSLSVLTYDDNLKIGDYRR